MALVELDRVRKIFRMGAVEVAALHEVSLAIEAGEFVAIVGASGSGKSTLLHVIGGLTPPSSGRIAIDGHDYGVLSDAGRTDLRRRAIGFVFQRFNLLPTLTARDNIELARSLGGGAQALPENGAANGAGDDYGWRLIERLGLKARLDHRPAELSGGEQQRVAIARALINRPRILLADEPTGNLDSVNAEQVLSIFQELNQELGQTLLMITHNPEAAARARRILHMRDGKLQME